MSDTATDWTLLPEHAEELSALRRFMDTTPSATEPARLIGPDGTHTVIPGEAYDALRIVVTALSEGKAVTIAPTFTTLTTQEAADLLHVSRPTLVKLLDDGAIPYTRPGRHRRLRLGDVLEFREQRRHVRKHALNDMVQASEELGLYDAPTDEPLRRD